jgi:uncharacterized membrane protein
LDLAGAYLLYVQLQIIGAICEWCVASDVVTAFLVALALLRLKAAAPAAPGASR